MGLMQRNKGKRYERAIAAELRAIWPDAIVRRASQAERADNPDVFIEGGPPVLARLWLELQDARVPTPMQKLEQAERDAVAWYACRVERYGHEPAMQRLPVVVWHRIGERQSHVTTRLWVLDRVRGYSVAVASLQSITLSFSSFVFLLNDYAPEARKEVAHG